MIKINYRMTWNDRRRLNHWAIWSPGVGFKIFHQAQNLSQVKILHELQDVRQFFFVSGNYVDGISLFFIEMNKTHDLSVFSSDDRIIDLLFLRLHHFGLVLGVLFIGVTFFLSLLLKNDCFNVRKKVEFLILI